MVTFKHTGDFKKTERFFVKAASANYLNVLARYGAEGVSALAAATPVDSGITASSWVYEIRRTRRGVVLSWSNTNEVDGVPIAIILQYGHATGTGGYVEGTDYINPVLRPIFDRIANDAWKGVTAQ
jgi:hypothetical protein